MSQKTHTTAAVLIPPEDVWGPIQAIRREHDRQFRRWMPHITLLYPFRPREQFPQYASAVYPFYCYRQDLYLRETKEELGLS